MWCGGLPSRHNWWLSYPLYTNDAAMGQSAYELGESLKSFLANYDAHAMSVIESSEPQIAGKIQEQLMQGKDGEGHYLKPYAWKEYADYKRTLNPLGVTDWKLTGDFYRHMQLRILDSRSFTIWSTGANTQNLIEIYGLQQMEQAMEMDDDSIDEYREERFNPFFVELIAAYTGVGVTNG